MFIFFEGKAWFEKCKQRLLPMTEEKIKGFAHSFLKCSHVFLERQDSVVLIKAVFFPMHGQ